jgi:hypothetical protein
LILMFAWRTSSSDTGKTMHMFSMALALLIVQNSVSERRASNRW